MDCVMTWIDVGTRDDIPRQGARRVDTSLGPVAVFRTHDDQVFALIDRCPHQDGPLSEGIVHGHAVTCPLHNLVIELPTGKTRKDGHGCALPVPSRVDDDGRVRLGIAAAAGGDHG